ncbi:hypothetical protein ASG97_03325 [Bacillus sp. Soil745]|nr:hypothetical protein ASG97_03325 [Bacillus sp. Soil745]
MPYNISKKSSSDWNVRYETPSCGKSVSWGDPQAQAEEAPPPPAESECLEWKSNFTTPQEKNPADFRNPLPFADC